MTPRVPPPCCRIGLRTPTVITSTQTNGHRHLHVDPDCRFVTRTNAPIYRSLYQYPPAWRQWCPECGPGD